MNNKDFGKYKPHAYIFDKNINSLHQLIFFSFAMTTFTQKNICFNKKSSPFTQYMLTYSQKHTNLLLYLQQDKKLNILE
ncbi:MAG: hypothetical protein Fur0023_19120 [Bacteroidia bacterium]